MTLPASLPLSMQQVADELGFSLPVSLADPAVISLAGKSAAPVSISDLLGKTGNVRAAIASGGSGMTLEIDFPSNTFFGGTISRFTQVSAALNLQFSVAPNFNGNIVISNTTTGQSRILSKFNATIWTGGGGGIIRTPVGYVDTYTVFPSA